MLLSIPQSLYKCQIYFQKIDQAGFAPDLRFFQTDAPTFERLAYKSILSILLKSVNVKFIFQKFSKKVDFAELPLTR